MFKKVLSLGIIALLGLAGCQQSGAGGGLSNSGDDGSDYPAEPIELIVPFDPGGGADFAGRTAGKYLESELGQSVSIVNVPGAGGQIGATELANNDPDGEMIGLISSGILTTYPAIRDTAYDLDDFDIIGRVAVSRQVLQVQADSAFKKLPDVVDYAKQHPGDFTYGTSGVGTTAHLAMAKFLEDAGIKAEHVVFDGLGAAKTSLLGGNIDAVIGPVTNSDESRIRPLASFSAERGATPKTIDMVTDFGYNPTLDVIHYLVAPKGTDPAVLQTLEDSLEAVADNDDAIAAFDSSDLELDFADADESRKELAEYKKLNIDLVDTLGIKE